MNETLSVAPELKHQRRVIEKGETLKLISRAKEQAASKLQLLGRLYIPLGYLEELETLWCAERALSELKILNKIEKAIREDLCLSCKQGKYLTVLRKREDNVKEFV